MVQFLVADIGGTNARFQLLEARESTVDIVASENLLVGDYANLQSCLQAFLKDRSPPNHCVLAVPGLIDDHRVWRGLDPWPGLAAEDLIPLGFHSVVFLNDLEAAGYGVLQLGSEQMFSLNSAGLEVKGAPKVLISAGTDLGTSFLTASKGVYTAYHSEGGGCCFCPKNALQEAYSQYVFRYEGERILCGQIVAQATAWHMYDFFLNKGRHTETVPLQRDTGEVFRRFLALGLEGKDSVCEESAELYTSIVGGIAGDWATKLLPRGGVYLLGGVLQNNAQGFQAKSQVLMHSFLSRPPHIRQTLSTIPVYLVKPGVTVGLLGAQWFALHSPIH